MGDTPRSFPLGDVADRLAGLGFHVFPLRPDCKTPATSSGWKAATTNRDQVKAWWSLKPRMNVGIATGPSRLVVLDLDAGKPWPGEGTPPAGVHSGADVLAQLVIDHGGDPGDLFDVPTVRTPSGGLHLYYRLPSHAEVKSSAGKVGPWIDVRARGGYVVAPFSHIDAGDYRPVFGWETIADATSDLTVGDDGLLNTSNEHLRSINITPAVLPEWLLELVRVKPTKPQPIDPWDALEARLDAGNATDHRYVTAALKRELIAVVEAPEGTRNDTLNKAAYSLATLIPTLPREVIESELASAAMAAGLPRDEAAATIRSGIRAGEANPRAVVA